MVPVVLIAKNPCTDFTYATLNWVWEYDVLKTHVRRLYFTTQKTVMNAFTVVFKQNVNGTPKSCSASDDA